MLEGGPATVIGIMPRTFRFPDGDTQMWLPMWVTPVDAPNGVKRGQIFRALARLKPGVSIEQAAAEGTARAMAAPDPGLLAMSLFGAKDPVQITVVDANEAATADVRPAIVILLIAAALLFATAIANVANMQLARAAARHRELTIRAALGAGTGRLSRQLLIENAVVGLVGAAMGVALSAALHRALPSLLPAGFPRADEIAIDGRVLAIRGDRCGGGERRRRHPAGPAIAAPRHHPCPVRRFAGLGGRRPWLPGDGAPPDRRQPGGGDERAGDLRRSPDAQLSCANVRRSRLRRHECPDGHRAVSQRLFVRATTTNTPAHARTPEGAAGDHACRIQHRRAAGVGRRIQLLRLRHTDQRCADSSRGDPAPGDAGLLRRVRHTDPCRSSADGRGHAWRTDGGGGEPIVRPQVSRRYADRAGDRAIAGGPGGSGHEARQESGNDRRCGRRSPPGHG